MRARALLAACAAGVLITSAAFAEDRPAGPARVDVTYDVSRDGRAVGRMRERFERRDDGTFSITSDSRALGLAALLPRASIHVTSRGMVEAGGLRPQRFERARAGESASAEMDWSGGRLTLRHDGKVDTLPLEPGTQDRLSAMYQFLFRTPVAGRPVPLTLTNGVKVERYRYDVAGGPTLETPAGSFRTVHLVKRREPGDNGTEIWLAESPRGLVVKLMVVESDGERLEQVLTRIDAFE